MTVMPQPGRFYPILPTADWVERICPLGIDTIQLRLKDAPLPEVKAQIAASLAACKAHGVQLIVNDYWREAIEAGCDYIHLGQEDFATCDLPAIRAAGLRLGLSTHNEAELAIALMANPDYIALGPIYETKLKAMIWKPQGLERITRWKRAVGEIPLVAIGGLTCERALGAFNAGADSLAVVTDLVASPDPVAKTAEWLVTVAVPPVNGPS